MDQQRGRSPSAGHQQSHISHSHSPHQFQENNDNNSIGLGLAVETSGNNQQQQFMNNGAFDSNNGLPQFVDTNNEFLNQQGQAFPQGGLSEATYAQTQDFSPQFKQEEQTSPYGQQQQPSFTQELLGANNSFNEDFSLFSTPNNQGDQFDPQFFMNDIQRPGNPSVNPAELNMSSPQIHQTPTPPSLLQPDSRSPSSAHQSPSFNQGQFQTSHSRNASLGPESAAFPQGHEWSMMPPQFTTHRRTPSEYSDVSVSSAQHSPNLGQHDNFESIEQHHSPMQNPQDAGLYQEVLGIGSFSLSDPQVQNSNPGRGLSPAHSPAISPRLGPQQLPVLNQNQFILGMNNGYGQQQNMYGQGQESFPQMQHNNGSLDMGQAQQMVPPEINVEFAPTSRQNSFEPPKPSFDQDALTPPDRGQYFQSNPCYISLLTESRSSSPSSLRSIQQPLSWRLPPPHSISIAQPWSRREITRPLSIFVAERQNWNVLSQQTAPVNLIATKSRLYSWTCRS